MCQVRAVFNGMEFVKQLAIHLFLPFSSLVVWATHGKVRANNQRLFSLPDFPIICSWSIFLCWIVVKVLQQEFEHREDYLVETVVCCFLLLTHRVTVAIK